MYMAAKRMESRDDTSDDSMQSEEENGHGLLIMIFDVEEAWVP